MAKTAEQTEAPTVDVVDLTGKKVGTVELPAAWFTGEVKVGVMHQVVTAQLAKARQGTAKTKTRGERRGGGRKPWRQKGTGRARHGSIRSPMWRKGGVAHGRTGEENFTKRVNKSMRRTALRSALTDRAGQGAVTVVRGLALDEPRTKDAVAAIEALGHADRRMLLVLGDMHVPTWKSFRNLPTVHLLTVDQLNTYDVLVNDVVVFDEDALALIGTGRRTSTPTDEEVE
jgi:large subunit ribosomal protein L4